ncbi:MAG: leucine-rich repeat protein [Ruminococcus sp.]|nr:leucine-rich repeat protein [Ruminococcus sp.]
MSTVKCMLKEAKTRRVILSVIAVMSLLAAFTVFFVLERPGVTMTDDTLPECLSVSESGDVTVIVPADEEPKYTGSVSSENLKWSIYENGVLYFEPIDPSKSYNISSSWTNHKNEVTAVKAAAGLSSIKIKSFMYCNNILAVDLSECSDIQSVGSQSFYQCFNLKYINFGNESSLTTIKDNAFWQCKALERFPFEQLSNITTIESGAFKECTSLKSADLSAMTGLNTIPDSLFDGCTSLADVNFAADNNISTIGKKAFYNCKPLETFPFEQLSNVELLGDDAFYNTSIIEADLSNWNKLTNLTGFQSCKLLKTVKVPDNNIITMIGGSSYYSTPAFMYCSSLETFPFEKLTKLEKIGTSAFSNCTSLTEADMSKCTELSGTLKNTFSGCSSLKTINFYDDCKITKLEDNVFNGCSSLEYIPFEKLTHLTEIYSFASLMFKGCSSLHNAKADFTNTQLAYIRGGGNNWDHYLGNFKEIDFTGLETLRSIGDAEFQGQGSKLQKISFKDCVNLTTVHQINNNTLHSVDFSGCSSLTSLPKSMFSNTPNITEVKLDGCTSLQSIGANAFYNCTGIKEINLKDAVALKTIDTQAFIGCTNLQEITIPENVETIGDKAFQNCHTLEKIDYNAVNATNVNANAFSGVGKTNHLVLNIGSTVDRLPDNIFAENVKISEINFAQNDSLVLGENALKSMGRPLSAMSDGTTEYYVDEFGAIYSKDKTTLYYIPHGLTSYTVPAGVTTIKKDCCMLADSLTSLTFEDISQVTTVESNAFAECKTLSSITADGTTVTTVDSAKSLFANATVGLHAFYHTGLTDVDSTSNLTEKPVQVETKNGEAREYLVTLQFVDRRISDTLVDKVADRLGQLDHAAITNPTASKNRIPSVEPVDPKKYYFFTGEVATMNVSVSAESAGSDTESGHEFAKYARVFFQCSSDNVIFENYIVGGTTTLTNNQGMEYELTFKQVENSNIYYLEFAMPYGNTLSFDSRVYVPNLTDQNATMKQWLQIVEKPEDALDLTPDEYQEAQWYTAIDKWSVDHSVPTTEYGFKAVSDGNGGIIPKIKNDIQFTVKNSKIGNSTKDSYGIDPTKAINYTEWLTLPEGLEWEPEIVNAIKNGDYYCVGSSPYIYLRTPNGNVLLAYMNTTCEDVKVVWDDEKNTPVLTYTRKNKNLSSTTITNDANYEMGTQNHTITYNADDIFKLADDYDFTQKKQIYSNVIQNPEYVFAKPNNTTKHTINTDNAEVPRDSVFEQAAKTSVVLGTAKPDIQFEKTALYNGVKYPKDRNFGVTENSKIEFALKVKNIGIVPGTVTKVSDDVPYHYVIRPEDMDYMFNDKYGDELTITIKNGYKDTSDKKQREPVTDINGNEVKVPAIEKGESMEKLDNITMKWAEDKSCLVLTCGDKTVNIGSGQEYETIKAYFDAIEFINVLTGNSSSYSSGTTYSCVWNMKVPEFASIEEREYVIPATVKSIFEDLNHDQHRSGTNYGNIGKNIAQCTYILNGSTRTVSSGWVGAYDKYPEFYIYKYYSVNGVKDAKTIKNGDIIDFQIKVSHKGTGELTGVPVNDYMTGSQSALAPVAGNENAVLITTDKDGNKTTVKLSEAGLRTATVDGADYYLLSEGGTYRDIWFGYDSKGKLLKADRIEVTKNLKDLTTRMYWYFDEVKGAVENYVNYKTIVDDKAGSTVNTGDMFVDNRAYVGEREKHRIYAYISDTRIVFVSASFNKNIVTEDPAGENEKLSKHTEIGMGNSVTYKLTLNNHSDYDQYFTNAYDMLPENYGKFVWKNDDVTLTTVSSMDTPNTSADKWKVSDIQPNGESSNGERYYLYFNDVTELPDPADVTTAENYVRSGLTLRPHETLDIYVTLKYPEGKVWTEYEQSAFDTGNHIVNHFCVSNKEATVSHDLKASGQAYLQKGVYGVYDAKSADVSGNNAPNKGTRTEYSNATMNFPIVTYYVTIYNSGNARLYLNDMIDTLPKGFTYRGMCAVSDYGSVYSASAISESNYIKANNSGTYRNQYLLTYRYKEGDSGRNINNILSPVTDVNNDSVEYMSVFVEHTTVDTNDVNGDYQEKMKFSFSNKCTEGNTTYTQSNIGYDSERKMCYLEKGQAVSFGYRCYVPEYRYTEDIANNRVSMQYYDYNDAGFTKSEGVTVTGNYNKYPESKNDGDCDIWSDFDASTAGLEGKYTSDWLTSDVDLVRGNIVPGVTKQITSKITPQGDKVDCVTGLMESTDTAEWTMTYSNNGTNSLDKYTITDTMQYPFYFTGDAYYTLYDKYGRSSDFPLTVVNSKCTFLSDIIFKDADGNEITKALDKYTKEDITVQFKTCSDYYDKTYYYNSYSVKLGEEKECSFYTGTKGKYGPDLDFQHVKAKIKFDIDEKYNCILQITFDENSRKVVSIPAGGYATMTVQTKLPHSEMALGSYINKVELSPNRAYDADNVIQGAVVRDGSGNPEGIETSSMVTISGAFSTTSWKTITDDSDHTNNAASRSTHNYIVLKWDDEQEWDETSEYPPCSPFTYALSVNNQCIQPINRMVIIDDLPEIGDHMSYGDETAQRHSEFLVALTEIAENKFRVLDEGAENEITEIRRVADSSAFSDTELGYTIEFSTATEFTPEDWDGAADAKWLSLEDAAQQIADNTLNIEDIRSFRVVVKGGNGIAEEHTLTIEANARIYGNVKPGQIAWNNFGYRYSVPIADGSDVYQELSASSLNVGIMTATTPKIQKTLKAGTGRDITAAELNASAEFAVYKGDPIDYTNEQELFKALADGNIDFTIVKLTPEQIDSGEYVSLDKPMKYSLSQDGDGNYSYAVTAEKFSWTEGEKYTFTEINLPENVVFSTMQGIKTNSCTITYVRNGRYKISCANIYDDYSIRVRKSSAKDSTPLEGAGIARYGVITGTSGSPEFEALVQQKWSEHVDGYIGAVQNVRTLETGNKKLHVLTTVDTSRLTAAKDSYADFTAIPGMVTELTDVNSIGQDFSQLYRIVDSNGTATVYYFIDLSMTNENGRITYPSEVENTFAFVETAAPEGFTLTNKLHIAQRGKVNSGETLYVDISDPIAEELPMTGGSGMLYIILAGAAVMLLSTAAVIVRIKRKAILPEQGR